MNVSVIDELVIANQLDIMVVDKLQKKTVTDVAIPSDKYCILTHHVVSNSGNSIWKYNGM